MLISSAQLQLLTPHLLSPFPDYQPSHGSQGGLVVIFNANLCSKTEEIIPTTCPKMHLHWASAPDPLGNLQCSPDLFAGGEGACCTLPKILTPALSL